MMKNILNIYNFDRFEYSISRIPFFILFIDVWNKYIDLALLAKLFDTKKYTCEII